MANKEPGGALHPSMGRHQLGDWLGLRFRVIYRPQALPMWLVTENGHEPTPLTLHLKIGQSQRKKGEISELDKIQLEVAYFAPTWLRFALPTARRICYIETLDLVPVPMHFYHEHFILKQPVINSRTHYNEGLSPGPSMRERFCSNSSPNQTG
jgi:hypothetical protein